MGGNVFKKNIRLPTNRALEIGNAFVTILKQIEPSLDAKIIPSYRNKNEHGDVDVLVTLPPDNKLDICKIVSSFNGTLSIPLNYSTNGDVVSYEFPLTDKESFQVDLIFVPQSIFNFAYNYFSWNDLGNFIGRFAHKMGLKFGHDGLKYPLRDSRINFYSEITLTENFSTALSFLGFDPHRFHRGFDSLEDIFEYVATNPRYYSEIFNLETRSHNARVRDKKRKSYQELLKWTQSHPEKDKPYRFNPNKTIYFAEIEQAFPLIRYERQALEMVVTRRLLFKERFCGQKISAATGFEGKDLGQFMAELRTVCEEHIDYLGVHFEDWVNNLEEAKWNDLVQSTLEVFNRRLWRRKILENPANWELSPFTSWMSIDNEMFVRKHPSLIKYISWETLAENTKTFLLKEFPDIFIVYVG